MSSYGNRYGDDALMKTINANLGVGADYALASNLRFERAVAMLAKRRFVQRSEDSANHPIIFVQHAHGPSSDFGRELLRVPMIDNGLTPIGGHVWLINAAGTEATGIPVDPDDSDISLFDMIRNEEHLRDRPTVVVETRQGLFEMRSYPAGLASDDVEVTDLTRKSISPDEVREALHAIWQKSLCTPTAMTSSKTGPWKNASSYYPHSDAEVRIQTILESGLKEHFKGFEVRHEQTQATGRLDLEIEEPHETDESTVTRHILLELKVVRDFSDTGSQYHHSTNVKTIRAGVDQARAYRDERKVRAAALCCYDMRKIYRGEAVFDEVKDDAKEWSVDLWLWHLFGKPSDYREFTRPARSEG